jgi:hypothetical protein
MTIQVADSNGKPVVPVAPVDQGLPGFKKLTILWNPDRGESSIQFSPADFPTWEGLIAVLEAVKTVFQTEYHFGVIRKIQQAQMEQHMSRQIVGGLKH